MVLMVFKGPTEPYMVWLSPKLLFHPLYAPQLNTLPHVPEGKLQAFANAMCSPVPRTLISLPGCLLTCQVLVLLYVSTLMPPPQGSLPGTPG